jgi:hypothetical protein
MLGVEVRREGGGCWCRLGGWGKKEKEGYQLGFRGGKYLKVEEENDEEV